MSDTEMGYGDDSDAELQEAFAKGLLKPGLNTVTTVVKKEFKNNVVELKRRLVDLKLSLPWVEQLDLINGLAPLAPELAFKMGEQEQAREVQLRNANRGRPVSDLDADPVLNDFRREMGFHRQAQAAVLVGIPRLKALGVNTRRPDDYFAQMAKSDEHMHKVRQLLQKKQVAEARSEKAKKQRHLKKIGKRIQVETKLRRDREKKELMEEVKKYRKGVRKDLGFLEDGPRNRRGGPAPARKGPASGKAAAKQRYKSQKFGYGGKKRGSKANTGASSADVSEYARPRAGAKSKGRQQSRPGKTKRIKMKSKKQR